MPPSTALMKAALLCPAPGCAKGSQRLPQKSHTEKSAFWFPPHLFSYPYINLSRQGRSQEM